MKAVRLQVISNKQVSQRYWHMVVDSSLLGETVMPGQFFHIRCADEYYPFLRRPLSIYRINKREQTLEFLYLVKGLGTKRMTEIAPGAEVDVFGPLGKGFTLHDSWDTILLLARGVGIATLAALAQEAAEKGIRCVAVLSARSRNDLLATETLQGFGAEVYKVTEEEGTSDVEHVREIIHAIMAKNDIKAAYVCGSKRLSLLLKEIVREKRIPAEIALEEHMGCAMGVCFACVCDLQEEEGLRTVRVCREGPVFPLEKVVIP
ncbi:MAG: dihydroorotate dehydrogenase electron transfer subunit [Brevibacillus sp.]|nr:dihydroorotate dehydrogenase electron transfer subunit [Brevibacillus sp.]